MVMRRMVGGPEAEARLSSSASSCCCCCCCCWRPAVLRPEASVLWTGESVGPPRNPGRGGGWCSSRPEGRGRRLVPLLEGDEDDDDAELGGRRRRARPGALDGTWPYREFALLFLGREEGGGCEGLGRRGAGILVSKKFAPTIAPRKKRGASKK